MGRGSLVGLMMMARLAGAGWAQEVRIVPRLEGLETIEDLVWYTAEMRMEGAEGFDRYSLFQWMFKYHGYTQPDAAQVRAAGTGLFAPEMRQGNPPAWIHSFDHGFQLPDDSWIVKEGLEEKKDEDVTLLIPQDAEHIVEVQHRQSPGAAVLFGERTRAAFELRATEGVGGSLLGFLEGSWDGQRASVRVEGSVHRDNEPAMFHLTFADDESSARYFLESELPEKAALVAAAKDDLPERRLLITKTGARMGTVIGRYYLKIGGDFMRPENQSEEEVARRYASWMNSMVRALFPQP